MLRSVDAGILRHCKTCMTLRAIKPRKHIYRYYAQSAEAVFKGKDHYEILGLKKNATQDEVKQAFFVLSKENHPDKNPDDPLNHEKFVKINEAYSVLSKPFSRREYDMSMTLKFQLEQDMKRGRYHMYGTGGMHSGPGSSYTGDFERDAGEFWDETIWGMRNKKYDKENFNDPDSFYGIKGIRRQPNFYIVGGCFFLIGIGLFLHLAAYKIAQVVFIEPKNLKEKQDLENFKKYREKVEQGNQADQIKEMRRAFEERAARMR